MTTPTLHRSGGLFTSCPVCEQQFRVRAKHLSAAGGQVECGTCGFHFNALPRLSDAPLTAEGIRQRFSGETPSTATKAPQLETTEPTQEPSSPPRTPRQPPPIPADDENDVAGAGVTTGWLRQPDTASAQWRSDEPPAILREPPPVKRSLWGTFFLAFIGLALGVALAAQLAWWNRDELLRRYPVITSHFERVCERLHCEIVRYRDPSAIGFVNRDIRTHPLYADGLLVNATMINRAVRTQPFPVIQLALFDVNHTVIAHRKFTPAMYLDDSINLVAGMAPETPVHFVLELAAPDEQAIGFEFYIL